MSKSDKWAMAIRIVIALGTTVTAVEAVNVARNGFEIELNVEDARDVVDNVNEILAARDSSLAGWEGEL